MLHTELMQRVQTCKLSTKSETQDVYNKLRESYRVLSKLKDIDTKLRKLSLGGALEYNAPLYLRGLPILPSTGDQRVYDPWGRRPASARPDGVVFRQDFGSHGTMRIAAQLQFGDEHDPVARLIPLAHVPNGVDWFEVAVHECTAVSDEFKFARVGDVIRVWHAPHARTYRVVIGDVELQRVPGSASVVQPIVHGAVLDGDTAQVRVELNWVTTLAEGHVELDEDGPGLSPPMGMPGLLEREDAFAPNPLGGWVGNFAAWRSQTMQLKDEQREEYDDRYN